MSVVPLAESFGSTSCPKRFTTLTKVLISFGCTSAGKSIAHSGIVELILILSPCVSD